MVYHTQDLSPRPRYSIQHFHRVDYAHQGLRQAAPPLNVLAIGVYVMIGHVESRRHVIILLKCLLPLGVSSLRFLQRLDASVHASEPGDRLELRTGLGLPAGFQATVLLTVRQGIHVSG